MKHEIICDLETTYPQYESLRDALLDLLVVCTELDAVALDGGSDSQLVPTLEHTARYLVDLARPHHATGNYEVRPGNRDCVVRLTSYHHYWIYMYTSIFLAYGVVGMIGKG